MSRKVRRREGRIAVVKWAMVGMVGQTHFTASDCAYHIRNAEYIPMVCGIQRSSAHLWASAHRVGNILTAMARRGEIKMEAPPGVAHIYTLLDE